jgi:hypothetical protein
MTRLRTLRHSKAHNKNQYRDKDWNIEKAKERKKRVLETFLRPFRVLVGVVVMIVALVVGMNVVGKVWEGF